MISRDHEPGDTPPQETLNKPVNARQETIAQAPPTVIFVLEPSHNSRPAGADSGKPNLLDWPLKH